MARFVARCSPSCSATSPLGALSASLPVPRLYASRPSRLVPKTNNCYQEDVK